jgi:hypothetical protein
MRHEWKRLKAEGSRGDKILFFSLPAQFIASSLRLSFINFCLLTFLNYV